MSSLSKETVELVRRADRGELPDRLGVNIDMASDEVSVVDTKINGKRVNGDDVEAFESIDCSDYFSRLRVDASQAVEESAGPGGQSG